jgi:hypothetical protein
MNDSVSKGSLEARKLASKSSTMYACPKKSRDCSDDEIPTSAMLRLDVAHNTKRVLHGNVRTNDITLVHADSARSDVIMPNHVKSASIATIQSYVFMSQSRSALICPPRKTCRRDRQSAPSLRLPMKMELAPVSQPWKIPYGIFETMLPN